MRLDLVARFRLRRLRFDHVGIERPLHEEAHVRNLGGLFVEDFDELVADRDALLLRIVDAGEPLEETLGGVDCDHVEMQHVAKRGDDVLRFVLAQQPRIDEHAGQLLADRARNQALRRRPNRRRRRARRSRSRCRRARGSLRSRARRTIPSPNRPRASQRRAGSSRSAPCRIRCGRPPDGTARRRCGARGRPSPRSRNAPCERALGTPAAARRRVSPCDIQTRLRAETPAKNGLSGRSSSSVAGPNSRCASGTSVPPRSRAINCMP